jgi:membrane protein YqaA with SNARE-associated domain
LAYWLMHSRRYSKWFVLLSWVCVASVVFTLNRRG